MGPLPWGEMARNLVVLADGTGNSAAAPFKTNVWRLYQALDLSQADQLACFADGVGTSSFRPFKIIGLALGFGVKRNVIELYKFLCRNYTGPADRIFGFGFSRGAFTIRELNALIGCEGLVSFDPAVSEEELHRNAVAAYRAYRASTYKPKWQNWLWVTGGRWLRDRVIALWNVATGARNYASVKAETRSLNRDAVRVHFLGVWDTVSAYGLPIDELTTAFDKWVWPMQFQELALPGNVDFARQAMSLDDERRTFFPLPWDEPQQARTAGASLDHEKLVQVWFAGAHANVGGGYPDDSLAHVPLCWMIGEATQRELRFRDWIVAGYAALASHDGPINDPRKGLGTFYRYQPRDVGQRMNGRVPLVDGSAILRMAHGNDGYAPISLPERIDVLAPNGCSIPFSTAGAATPLSAPTEKLRLPAGQDRKLAAQQARLLAAIPALILGQKQQRATVLDLALDTVWWRRVVYFATLFLVAWATIYPFAGGYVRSSLFETAESAASGPVAQLVRLLRGFVPAPLAPWLDTIAEFPIRSLIIAIGIGALLAVSAWLKLRIHDRARVAWGALALTPALSQRRRGTQRQLAARATLFFAVWTLLSWTLQDGEGEAARHIDELNKALLGITLLGAVTWVVLLLRPAPAPASTVNPGWLLGVARCLRTSNAMVAVYRFGAKTLAPLFFLALTGLLGLTLVNRLWFDIASSRGSVCRMASPETVNWTEAIGPATSTFKTEDLC